MCALYGPSSPSRYDRIALMLLQRDNNHLNENLLGLSPDEVGAIPLIGEVGLYIQVNNADADDNSYVSILWCPMINIAAFHCDEERKLFLTMLSSHILKSFSSYRGVSRMHQYQCIHLA